MLFLNENVINQFGAGSAAKDLQSSLSKEQCALQEHFMGDEISGMEIALEVETSWAALTEEMMSVEHASIVNENATLLQEAAKGWWEKIKEFFKSVWATVSGWFRKVWDKITGFFQNAEKWLKANGSKMKGTHKLTTYKNIADGSILANSIKAMQDSRTLMEVVISDAGENLANAEKANDDLDKDYEKIDEVIYGEKSTSEYTMGPADVTKIIAGSNAMLAALKGGMNEASAIAKTAIGIADSGFKTADDDGAKNLKDAIHEMKRASSMMQKTLSKHVSAVNTAISTALSVGKALVRGGDEAKKE